MLSKQDSGNILICIEIKVKNVLYSGQQNSMKKWPSYFIQ